MKVAKFFWMFLFPFLVGATEYAPWYPRDVELQTNSTLLYQSYKWVNTPKGFRHKGSDDLFLNLSGAIYYTVYGVELETSFAHTHHQKKMDWDSLSLTGRYQLYDDVLGDPFSLVIGGTVRQVFKVALHDRSCFYHGGIEGEIHLAAGVETSLEQFWVTHLWGVLGAGLSDRGSPWIRFNAAWERNWWDQHALAVFLNTLWGLGGEGLHPKHFHGYGSIKHDSIDLGLTYTSTLKCGGSISFGYSRRLFAQNCPQNVNRAFLTFYYPIGLGI